MVDLALTQIGLWAWNARRPRLRSCMMADDVDPWYKFFYVLVGAFGAAYYTKDSPSGVARIKLMFPHWNEHSYARLDFLFGLSISTVASYVLYAPQDPIKALIAGFSSVALVKQLIARPRR